MREIGNKEDWCIFEWLLCIDLKGYITRYVLDNVRIVVYRYFCIL